MTKKLYNSSIPEGEYITVEHYKKSKISKCDNVTYSMLTASQVEFRHLPDGSVEWKYKGEKSYEWKILIDNSNFPDFTWKEKEF